MLALNLFNRNPEAPRVTLRERMRRTAAKVRTRFSRKPSGAADPSRRAVMVGTLSAVAAAPFSAVADFTADGELLRLCREHDVFFARAMDLNAGRISDPDEIDGICEDSAHLEFAVQDIPAQTWAGVIEKARIAAEYADRCQERSLENIMPSQIEDILRLGNAAAKRHQRFH